MGVLPKPSRTALALAAVSHFCILIAVPVSAVSSSSPFLPSHRRPRLRSREHNGSCSQAGTKACCEKMRREKMNDRFLDLSSVLEPGRPAKTDKSAILSDAIHVLNQLITEAEELKDKNEKLQEDIKSLKGLVWERCGF